MKILEGKRLILFPFAEKDFDYFMKIQTYKGGSFLDNMFNIKSEEDIKNYVWDILKSLSTITWTVCSKQGKGMEKLGFIMLTNYIPELSANFDAYADKKLVKNWLKIKKEAKKKESGISFPDKTWAYEAIQLVIPYCFNELKLKRLGTIHDIKNKFATEVCLKNGFKKEGIIRNANFKDGKTINLIMLSIIKEDLDKEK